jgi:basic membrane protein A
MSVMAKLLLGTGLLIGMTAGAFAAQKAAFLPCGQVNDESWSQAGYEAMLLTKKNMGLDFDYVESPAPADVENIGRDYARKGYNPIVFHCATFVKAARKIAEDFPKTSILLSTGGEPVPSNLAIYMPQHEYAFMGGVLAGLMTKSNVVGAVNSFKFPELNREVEGFKLGVRYVNPNAKILSTFINSWTDVDKAKTAAVAQLDAGADVIAAIADRAAVGAIKAAQERGAYSIGFYRDLNHDAPDSVLTSIIIYYTKMLADLVGKSTSGEMKGKVYNYTAADGYLGMAGYGGTEDKVPMEVKTKVKQINDMIMERKIELPVMAEEDAAYKFDLKSLVKP